MTGADPRPRPAPSPEQLARLRALYAQIDGAVGAWVAQHPDARCPAGCHDCCQTAAPLVSEVEVALVEELLCQHVDAPARDAVRARSLASRAELEAGAPDDFVCPLLEGGRCLVYPARPYLCRSFGHSARRSDAGLVNVYTCAQLRPALTEAARVGAPPPLLAFRSAALRSQVSDGELVDSYLPIWLSTGPHERRLVWRDDSSAVVVAAEEHRAARPASDEG